MTSVPRRIIATNRKASFNYSIEDRLEAGIMLTGPETKSLRFKGSSIEDAHADFINGELYILNMYIAEYDKAKSFTKHHERKPRKLLVHKKQANKFLGKIKEKGYTLIATSLYFNEKNMAKIELALAKGKKLHDKREDIKQKDWNREQSRLIREK